MIETKIKNYALRAIKMHPVKREWKVAILLTALMRLLTMAISWYAGIYYLHSLVNPVFKDYVGSMIAAITALFLLEGLVAIFLAKGFKFIFKGQWQKVIPSLALVAILWAVSFHISTNGLAQRQSQEADKTNVITEKYQAQINQVKSQAKNQISELKQAIQEIRENPAGWSGGRRTELLASQQEQIQQYYDKIGQIQQDTRNEIGKIQQEKQTSLNNNRRKTTNQADKYYNVVAYIMVGQFIFTGILIFLLTLVFKEEAQEDYVAEKLQPVQQAIEYKMVNTVASYATLLQQKVNDSLNTMIEKEKDTNLALSEPVSNNKDAKQTEEENQEEEEKNQEAGIPKIGFRTPGQTSNTEKNNTHANPNDLPLTVTATPHVNDQAKNSVKIPTSFTEFKAKYKDIDGTQYLVKHRNITEKLLERRASPENHPTLAKISRNTRKSYSTVQNVQRVLNEVMNAQEGGQQDDL